MGMFDSNNMILTFSNIIFFIVVQTLFFYFIASKQFNIVLGDKVGIFNEYVSRNKPLKEQIRMFFASKDYENIKEGAKEEEEDREEYNQNLLKSWILPPLSIATTILLLFILKLFLYDEPWSEVDTVGLFLVVTAYTTEILFYLGIVQQFKFYGDNQIFQKLYSTMNENINVTPTTPDADDLFIILQLLNSDNDLKYLFLSENYKKQNILNIKNQNFSKLKEKLKLKNITISDERLEEINNYIEKNKDNIQEILKSYI
mgnify:CR=1 FL=1